VEDVADDADDDEHSDPGALGGALFAKVDVVAKVDADVEVVNAGVTKDEGGVIDEL
jgi:hypothetical protein